MSKSTLIIGTWNKGGDWRMKLRSKIIELAYYINYYDVDVLVVTEANVPKNEIFTIPGYEILVGGENNTVANHRCVQLNL